MTPLTHLRRVAEAAKAAHASWPDTNLESPAPSSSYKAVIAFEQTFDPALVSLLLEWIETARPLLEEEGYLSDPDYPEMQAADAALAAALSKAEQERDALIQEREHPFDASEFKALHHRAEAAERERDENFEALMDEREKAVAAEARERELREALEEIAKDDGWVTTWHVDEAEPELGRQPSISNHAGEIARRALQATQEDGAASALTNSEARPACSCSWMTTDGVPSRIPSLSCAAHADSEARGE